jgi:hypothetical protein
MTGVLMMALLEITASKATFSDIPSEMVAHE